MVRKIIKPVFFIAVLCVFFGVLMVDDFEGFDRVRHIPKGETYRLHTEPLVPREEIDIMIAEDGKLYLFYIDNELLNVYSVDGAFLYGFQFPDGQNGRADMAVVDGLLYVEPRVAGVYVFQESELAYSGRTLQDYEGQSDPKEIFSGMEDHEDGGYTYSYLASSNKILRRTDGEYETVLEFPKRLVDTQTICFVLLLLVVAAEYLWPSKKD